MLDWLLIICTSTACDRADFHAVTGVTREQCQTVVEMYEVGTGARCVSPDGKIYTSGKEFLAEDYPNRRDATAGAK